MSESTTIRIRSETRDRLNRLARVGGISASELIAELVDRAEADELFAQHAAAFRELRDDAPASLAAIEREDAAWHESDLASPPGPA